MSRKQRLGGCHLSFRKTELFQQKARPGSHPALPESIPNQQLLLPVWATTSACPEKASDSSAFTKTKPETHPSPLPTESPAHELFPSPHQKADYPTQSGTAPVTEESPSHSKQAAATDRALTQEVGDTCSATLGGGVQHSPCLHILEYALPERGAKEGVLLALCIRTAELARQKLCSTRGPSKVVGTRLRASVWFSFISSELVCPGPAHEPT